MAASAEEHLQGRAERHAGAGDMYRDLDRFGRVVDQRWYNTATTLSPDRYRYAYDRDGNVIDKFNVSAIVPPRIYSDLDMHYAYDGLNRLGAEDGYGSAPATLFGMDAVGNITGITVGGATTYRTVNSLNQLVGTGTDSALENQTAITYDANGNMAVDDQGRLYVYDAWNRLVAVENADMTLIAAYSYDGLGRRIQETTVDSSCVLHKTDLYYSASWQVLEERHDGQTVQRNYYSPVYVNAIVARDDDTDSDGTPDRRLFVTQDANFNSTTILDSSGNIQEHFVYSAYGVKATKYGDWTAKSGDTLNFRNTYQGGREDVRTGLMNFQMRDYNPRTLTWNTADPIQDGMNWHAFCAANPINHVDPSGLLEQTTADDVVRDFLRTFSNPRFQIELSDDEIISRMLGKLGDTYLTKFVRKIGTGLIFAPLKALPTGMIAKIATGIGEKLTEKALEGKPLSDQDIESLIVDAGGQFVPLQAKKVLIESTKSLVQKVAAAGMGPARTVHVEYHDSRQGVGFDISGEFVVMAKVTSGRAYFGERYTDFSLFGTVEYSQRGEPDSCGKSGTIILDAAGHRAGYSEPPTITSSNYKLIKTN